MKGVLLSLGILIPTILPSQIRLVPFPGIFSTYIGAHLSKRQFRLRPLSRGPFFNHLVQAAPLPEGVDRFRPLFWGPFFQFVDEIDMPIIANIMVFVPFLGDFFSMCGN